MKACATIRKHLANNCVDDHCDRRNDDDGDVDNEEDGNGNCGHGNGDCGFSAELNTGGAATAPGNHPGQSISIRSTNTSTDPPCEEARKPKRKELVLDVREPHVVKYDLSRKERQKLDMHTDKSEWTFLIALSEGRGMDYGEGGTYFEALDATVHLQRCQMLIFRGKLRHKGVKITKGSRYLLVGFLVDKNEESVAAGGGAVGGNGNIGRPNTSGSG